MSELRPKFPAALAEAMRARDTARTGTMRLILAKLKDVDIAARPGLPVGDDAIVSMLRGMVKQRRESVELYARGGRGDLVDKENAEIAVIEGFLPQAMDAAALAAAVGAAIAETRAAGPKDMGRVMAALKARHGAAMDMAAAGALVRERLK